jgi:hypothetical protein
MRSAFPLEAAAQALDRRAAEVEPAHQVAAPGRW